MHLVFASPNRALKAVHSIVMSLEPFEMFEENLRTKVQRDSSILKKLPIHPLEFFSFVSKGRHTIILREIVQF
jgi:hypothetical protein